MDKERYDEDLASAGWEPDGNFSEHLAIGHAGELCLIVPRGVWGRSGGPVFELHDVEKYLSYWVGELPTPHKAAELLREHGGPPEEERGKLHTRTG